MDATQTAKSTLVGFSFGNAVTNYVASQHPDRVEAVVSLGAWPPIIAPYAERFARFNKTLP